VLKEQRSRKRRKSGKHERRRNVEKTWNKKVM